MRAPRTCPAVRMRRATAAQGKVSTVLSTLFSHPSEKGRGAARDRWSGAPHGKPGGAATPHETTPSLKGAALSRPGGCERLTVAVNNYRSTSSERDQGSELNPKKTPHSSIRHLERPGSWQQAFPLGPGTEPLSCSGARHAP